MERYKQISNEHAHEFNASQEMKQTQELLDEDSHSSIMGSKDISSLVREVPRLLAFIEQYDLGTSYIKFQNVWNIPITIFCFGTDIITGSSSPSPDKGEFVSVIEKLNSGAEVSIFLFHHWLLELRELSELS